MKTPREWAEYALEKHYPAMIPVPRAAGVRGGRGHAGGG